ncbi:MAG: hypothetical protein WCY41_05250 [Candidatus Micrarchaeia archaeon]
MADDNAEKRDKAEQKNNAVKEKMVERMARPGSRPFIQQPKNRRPNCTLPDWNGNRGRQGDDRRMRDGRC